MTGWLSVAHRQGAFRLELESDLQTGVTAIFGPSGAGKSTLLRIIAGLQTPDQGKIVVGDRVWFDRATGENLSVNQRRVGFVFQEPRLFPHMSVARNLTYGMRRSASKQAFGDMAELLDIGDLLNRRPANLSGGEAQRVALGRALLSEPDLLLLDEPLSALDFDLKQQISPYFARLRDHHGIPILYVTHDIDEVARLADHMVLLREGSGVAAGPVDQVLAQIDRDPEPSADIAGGLLTAVVTAPIDDDHLTQVKIAEHILWLPGAVGQTGETVRLRIDARDVTLSRVQPEGLSALNILPVRITGVEMLGAAGSLVRLDHAGQSFVARLTRRSLRLMELQTGDEVFAILKSMSATPSRVSGR
ncbi:MAG: molybdenum ABC transporter ATP-binding protein [Pseudomonadota bacterium]